jgi:hypothetical protein
MARDPIVQEVRSIREEFARRHDYDLDAIVQALQKASSDAGRRLVSLPPKPVPEDQELRNLG